MFFTISLYRLLITKLGFMLIITLSNYQLQCPLFLNGSNTAFSHIQKYEFCKTETFYNADILAKFVKFDLQTDELKKKSIT